MCICKRSCSKWDGGGLGNSGSSIGGDLAAPQCILWIGTSVCRGTTIGPLEHEVTMGSAVNFPCTLSGLPPLVGLSSVDLGYPLIIDDCLSEMSC